MVPTVKKSVCPITVVAFCPDVYANACTGINNKTNKIHGVCNNWDSIFFAYNQTNYVAII